MPMPSAPRKKGHRPWDVGISWPQYSAARPATYSLASRHSSASGIKHLRKTYVRNTYVRNTKYVLRNTYHVRHCPKEIVRGRPGCPC
jgi:hypothetical protein